jgi:hypothetical protein
MWKLQAWFWLMYAKWTNWRARRAEERALSLFEKLIKADPNNAELQEKYHNLRRMLINNKVQKNAIDADLERLRD